jgi:hypothetical protein
MSVEASSAVLMNVPQTVRNVKSLKPLVEARNM